MARRCSQRVETKWSVVQRRPKRQFLLAIVLCGGEQMKKKSSKPTPLCTHASTSTHVGGRKEGPCPPARLPAPFVTLSLMFPLFSHPPIPHHSFHLASIILTTCSHSLLHFHLQLILTTKYKKTQKEKKTSLFST